MGEVVSPSVFQLHKLPSLPEYLSRGDPWGSTRYSQTLRSTYKARVDPFRGRNQGPRRGEWQWGAGSFWKRQQILAGVREDGCYSLKLTEPWETREEGLNPKDGKLKTVQPWRAETVCAQHLTQGLACGKCQVNVRWVDGWKKGRKGPGQ